MMFKFGLMVAVGGGIYHLVKKRNNNDDKFTQMLDKTEKNNYNEKLTFLDSQKVCV